MTAKITYKAGPSEAGERIDMLVGMHPDIRSRSEAARLIENGNVLINGVPTTKSKIVSLGDHIEIEIPERYESELFGEAIPLDIRYEDDHLIVLSKQPGLVCHPTEHHHEGTLVNALIYHCGIDRLGTLQGEDRPGIVHRLDRDTSGLMLAAKTTDVQQALQEAIQIRAVDRRYLTLVHGRIAPDTGLIDAPIARDDRDRLRMAVSDGPGARQAVTTFSVLERFDATPADDGSTLLECKLYTGRTHQIRAHMEYIHHPVVGDPVYGKGTPKMNHFLDRQFLHSYKLAFDHPVTGEHMEFRDDLPGDLQRVLEKIAPYSEGRTEIGHAILESDL